LDEGEDQLGIFLPLVLDVLDELVNKYFAASDVQEAVAVKHGVSMPLETVGTLLKRATRSGVLVREAGRFRRTATPIPRRSDVAASKAIVEAGQLRLGTAFLEFARPRGLTYPDAGKALDGILGFLEVQQVAVILGAPIDADPRSISRAESSVVADFLGSITPSNPELTEILKGIIEGLVLYHAAFLPDLADITRRFADLTVVFDTVLVRQALGYEGTAPQAMMRETVSLLTKSGVRCVVFDKSLGEMRRLLSMYQERLATTVGRASLRQSPMTRHLLTHYYSPSDIQEMSALLEDEIRAAGFSILRAPTHVAAFTHGEAQLAVRLADPRTRDVTEPRVEHDVDCVAGVLTLRRGHRTQRIEDARAIFATVSSSVLETIRSWWEEDEREASLAPAVHIRALVNLAWLKKPLASTEFQIRDLVALCAAAMRPSPRIWRRFIGHLDGLSKSQRLSEDQVTAIVVSAMSDRLLRDAEADTDDPNDVDSGTLDEVVDRVIADYTASAEARLMDAGRAHETQLVAIAAEADARRSEAEKTAQNAVELLRQRDLRIVGRARLAAGRTAASIYWVVVAIVVVGSIAIATRYSFEGGWIGVAFGITVLVIAALELAGVLGQLRTARRAVEDWLYRRFTRLFGGDDPG
jgi:hypothetical protein